MSKFKAGDKVYALGYPHRDWEYEILMVDLKSATGEDAILVRAIKVPKLAVVSTGYASLLNEDKVAKLPTIIKYGPWWHVYYSSPNGSHEFFRASLKQFASEEDVRNYFVHTYRRECKLLYVERVEREFEVD